MIDISRLESRLNPRQLEAVTHGEGPLLILAGAGSGKTRVITHRIAWLVASEHARPHEIVAVTFTNKAAGEMRDRVESLLDREIAGSFVGTFHAFGLRILRQHSRDAGLGASFVIYDSGDQLSEVRDVLKSESIDDKAYPPRQVLSRISKMKSGLLTVRDAEEQARFPHEKVYARCYALYEERLARASAVDFDDLLVRVIRLFDDRPDIAARFAERTRWLLVDEFQDTNPIQYRLIRNLTEAHRNVCCVGDEDQSIYSFRGADIRNILDFERDYPDASIVKLEQNYRSTGTVLEAASSVIANNLDRHEKTLWTENPGGPKITLYVASDDRDEADFVVSEMLRLRDEAGLALDECGILYRTNATSRLLEDRLTNRNIPYRVYGGLRFYERREIKDVVAWLRVLVHPDSDQDFLRVASTPPRGIGARTLAEIRRRAEEGRTSLVRAAGEIVAHPDGPLAARARNAVSGLLTAIRDLERLVEGMPMPGIVTSIIENVGYPAYLERAFPGDHASRAENLEALVSAAQEHEDAGAPDGLAGFLDRVSLRTDADAAVGENGPSLMTVHAAKGLEFDAVFIVGLNEELFPHAMSSKEENGIEEERRLAYVALTRARRKLVLAAARFRYQYGEPVLRDPSRFIGEIPAHLVSTRGAELRDSPRPSRPARRAPRGRARDAGRATPPPATPAAGTGQRSGTLSYVSDDAEEEGFRPGMRVIHPAFGPGRVLSATGHGRRLTLDIRFEAAGRKRILPAYTHLIPG